MTTGANINTSMRQYFRPKYHTLPALKHELSLARTGLDKLINGENSLLQVLMQTEGVLINITHTVR